MTRDELIERIARQLYANSGYPDVWRFEDSGHIRTMMTYAAQRVSPAVVEFVAEWLEEREDGSDPDRMAVRWREAMGNG